MQLKEKKGNPKKVSKVSKVCKNTFFVFSTEKKYLQREKIKVSE